MQVKRSCYHCSGTGYVAGDYPACYTCGGRGVSGASRCMACHGTGRSDTRRMDPCLMCSATGKIEEWAPDPPAPTPKPPKGKDKTVKPSGQKTKSGGFEQISRIAIFAVTAWYVFDQWMRHANVEPWVALGVPVVAGLVAQALWKVIVALLALALGYAFLSAEGA